MKTKEIIAIVLMIISTIITLVLIMHAKERTIRKNYDVELIARAPEKGNWHPGTFRISSGKEARILIRNVDTISHGFAVPDFQVAVPEIKAGTVHEVRFTPDKKGTFPFMCTVWCSDNHMEMRGSMIVE